MYPLGELQDRILVWSRGEEYKVLGCADDLNLIGIDKQILVSNTDELVEASQKEFW